MSKDPFDISNIKQIFPKKEFKEIEKVLNLLNKNQTGKSLELSIGLFERINKTAASMQAGAGSAITAVFDKMISSSGIMGPFNTFLTLLGGATAQASADALSVLYEVVTSQTTIDGINTMAGAFGTALDGMATAVTALDTDIDFFGVDVSALDIIIGGLSEAFKLIIDPVNTFQSWVIAFMNLIGLPPGGGAPSAATPTEPVGRGRIGGGGIPGVGNVPGAPSKLRTQFGIGGGANQGIQLQFNDPLNLGVVGGAPTKLRLFEATEDSKIISKKLDELINLQRRAWGQ